MLSIYTTTSAGGRPYNEDRVAVFQDKERWCCVLADGLGGMGGGAEAAECAIRTLQECFKTGQMQEDTLQECCQFAHQAISSLRDKKGQIGTMFSTVVLLYGTQDRIAWTHCGDSRLYLFWNDTICFRTKDHSVPQMLANCGEIREEEIRSHPDRNRLLSSLGMEGVEAKLSPVGTMDLRRGLSALLCSDGYWGPVTEAEMLNTLAESKNVVQWVDQMSQHIASLPQISDMDNYSAIGLWDR